LRTTSNRTGNLPTNPIALLVILLPSAYIKENKDLEHGIHLIPFTIYHVARSNSSCNRVHEYRISNSATGVGFSTCRALNQYKSLCLVCYHLIRSSRTRCRSIVGANNSDTREPTGPTAWRPKWPPPRLLEPSPGGTKKISFPRSLAKGCFNGRADRARKRAKQTNTLGCSPRA
jgi:hypothetical protein